MKMVTIKTLSHFSNLLVMEKEKFDELFPEPVDTVALAKYIEENRVAEITQKFLQEDVLDVSEISLEDATKLFNSYNHLNVSNEQMLDLIQNA